MFTFLKLILCQIVSSTKTRAEIQFENALLRYQIDILRRNVPMRLRISRVDRSIFKLFLKLWPRSARFVQIVHPKTVIRWHREGFRIYWRFKSRRFGRPRTENEIRMLIRKMAIENSLWGAPRVHGELMKLGFDVSQATVSRYLPRQRPNPDQTWKTFIRNHLDCSAAIDFFVVPTLTFRVLYVFVILNLERRKLVHLAITAHPTSAWTTQQMTEVFPWEEAPRYFIRDQDCTFGAIYKLRLNAMGISDTPVAPRSPWQNAYVERVIGSIRRECLDHVVVMNERHLRRILKLYMVYYNRSRTHLSLNKDPPIRRPFSPKSNGQIVSFPEVGGLHHRYERIAAQIPPTIVESNF